MKIAKFLAMMLMAMTVGTFCACSDDDDDDNGGSGKVTLDLGGYEADLNTVYWTVDEDNAGGDGSKFYQLEFYSYDFYNPGSSYPSSFSAVYISFMANGSDSEIPAGTYSYGSYEVSGAVGASVSNPEGRYYVEEAPGSGSLVISKNGSDYTVTINPFVCAYAEPQDDGSVDGYATAMTNFSYTGRINRAPAME